MDGDSPDGFGALKSVGGPLISLVEALGAEVVDRCEEVCVLVAERSHVGTGGGDQCDAEAEAPRIGIDIEGGELAVVGKIGLLRGARGGEAPDDVAIGGDDGVGVGITLLVQRGPGRPACWRRALKVALEAEDVDGDSPDGFSALESVGGPLVGFIKAMGTEVVDEGKEVGVAKAERDEVGARG